MLRQRQLRQKIFTVLILCFPLLIIIFKTASVAKASLPEIKDSSLLADIHRLQSSNSDDREDAAYTLCGRGSIAKIAIPQLLKAAEDNESKVRAAASLNLGCIVQKVQLTPEESAHVIDELTLALNDPVTRVRYAASMALGKIGSPSKVRSATKLQNLLHDSERDVRFGAAYALAQILGREATDAVPVLIEILSEHPDENVQADAAFAIGRIQAEEPKIVIALTDSLKSRSPIVRSSTIFALGEIGSIAKDSTSQIIKILLEAAKTDSDEFTRIKAIDALFRIGKGLRENRKNLSKKTIQKLIQDLEEIKYFIEEDKTYLFGNHEKDIRSFLNEIKVCIAALKEQKNAQREERFIKLLYQHFLQIVILFLFSLYLITYVVIYLLRPRWILFFPSNIKIPKTEFKVQLSFLKYDCRVLDAWVNHHIESVRGKFERKTTVSERAIHLSLPIKIDDSKTVELNSKEVEHLFKEKRWFLLIHGESGSGKTSIACQLARWAMSDDPEERLCNHLMIPIFIEQELNWKFDDGKIPLIELIRGQLQELVGEKIKDEDFFEQLLVQRRILVIIDRFSEMSEATQKEIQPLDPRYSANASIVISRFRDTFDKVSKSTLTALRLNHNELRKFLQSYLHEIGKLKDITDSTFDKVCEQLIKIIRHQDIPVLFVKLYAKYMISEISGNVQPSNIPELMLLFINKLNSTVSEAQIDDFEVQKDAQIVAWECVKKRYYQTSSSRSDLLLALGEENANKRLDYLEKKLRIIQIVEPSGDIRFSLDPVAEYLAALYLVGQCGSSSRRWQQEFINKVNRLGTPTIQGFLQAVYDCCLLAMLTLDIPPFVIERLREWIATTEMAQLAFSTESKYFVSQQKQESVTFIPKRGFFKRW